MIHRKSYDEVLDGIIAVDSRYHRDAYHFVREGLDYTQESIAKQEEGAVRHFEDQCRRSGTYDRRGAIGFSG